MNSSAKWKKITGVILLFFYCTNMLNIPALQIFNIINILYVLVMNPDIARDATKFGRNRKSLLLIPFGAIAIIGIQAILWDNIIMAQIKAGLGIAMENANTENVISMVKENPVMMGFMACFYGPILEELLYRYTAFGLIRNRSRALAYIVSTLLFGFQHIAVAAIYGGDLIQLINMPEYIIAGLIFAFLYDKTENICVPVGAHILANSFGLLSMVMNNVI
ncbi:MAG: CPBP family intramembrane metalloprotease [Lachnospiraceae bacterium]|nr:CPBP family intramembrane metalloprotease [Lachnospiraceae bacterium]